MSIDKMDFPVGQNDEGVKSPTAAEIEKKRRLRDNIQKEDACCKAGI